MHDISTGLKAQSEDLPPYIIPRPRRWGARLLLPGGRPASPGREDPAPLWLYVLGDPEDGSGPAPWPLGWGTVEGDPTQAMDELAGPAGWFELAADRCVWSLWIDLVINCWQGDADGLVLLRRARAEARREERRLQRQAYGVAAGPFEAFLQRLIHPDPVPLDPAVAPFVVLDGRGAEPYQVAISLTRDQGLLLRFVPLDFGGPLPPELEYHLDAEAVDRARLELGLLGGELFDDPASFVRVMRAQFEDLRQGLRWLREAGVWRPAAPGG